MNQKLSINPVPPYHLPQIHSSEILITSLPPASGDRLQTPQFGHQDEFFFRTWDRWEKVNGPMGAGFLAIKARATFGGANDR